SSQITIIQDGGATGATADRTFQQFRELGATATRIVVPWSQVAPDNRSFTRPHNFNGSSPSDYSNESWAPYDAAVRAGHRYGIAVDFVVAGGAPQWAEAKVPGGWNAFFAFKPNASEYGKFMTAVAKRYSGTYPD